MSKYVLDEITKLTSSIKVKLVVILLSVLLCMIIGVFFLWWMPRIGIAEIQNFLLVIFIVILCVTVFFLIVCAIILFSAVIKDKNSIITKWARAIAIRIFFPFLFAVSRLLLINQDEIRRAFIAINNKLVLSFIPSVYKGKILLLLPHCIQYHECDVRLIHDLQNCKKCGKCRMKDIISLSNRYEITIAVATGGTLARKIVLSHQPTLIIAVACERDLVSGIQDTYSLPVLGILNNRPNGPCFDTDISLELINDILRILIKENGAA